MRGKAGKRRSGHPTHSSRAVAVERRAAEIALQVSQNAGMPGFTPMTRDEGTGWHRHLQLEHQHGGIANWTPRNRGEESGYLAREIYIANLEATFKPDQS